MAARYENSPGLITKRSNHPLAQLLLGSVVGAHWIGTALVLYYEHHKVAITTDAGQIVVADYEVPSC